MVRRPISSSQTEIPRGTPVALLCSHGDAVFMCSEMDELTLESLKKAAKQYAVNESCVGFQVQRLECGRLLVWRSPSAGRRLSLFERLLQTLWDRRLRYRSRLEAFLRVLCRTLDVEVSEVYRILSQGVGSALYLQPMARWSERYGAGGAAGGGTLEDLGLEIRREDLLNLRCPMWRQEGPSGRWETVWVTLVAADGTVNGLLRLYRRSKGVLSPHEREACTLAGRLLSAAFEFGDGLRRKERTLKSLKAAQVGLWSWQQGAGIRLQGEWILRELGWEEKTWPMRLRELQERIHPDDIQTGWETLTNLPQGEEAVRLEIRLRAADGTFLTYAIRGAVVEQAPGGAPTAMMGAVANVTSRKTQVSEYVQALDQAKRANHAKSEFLANMSHELRTPMNAVLGMAGLLQTTELSEEQRELAETIERSGEALLHVLNDVLDFSKVEAGKLKLETVAFSLPDLLKRVDRLFRLEANKSGVQLRFVCDEHLSTWVVGDPARLQQVLVNLVGNALKFTPQGWVKIMVSQRKGDIVRFSVQDTGIGMSREVVEQIFDPFSQGDPSTTRRYGGTGLGLAISQRLCRLLGSELGVVSREGEGSTFHFEVRLPALPVERGSYGHERTSRREEASLSELRVLLAEDNPVNQRVATLMLERLGVELTVVGDGQAAVLAAQTGAFDLILMDIQMPIMDGLAATRNIRRALPRSGQPVIAAMTASAMSQQRQACFDAGVDRFVPKPVRLDELKTLLREVSHHRRPLAEGAVKKRVVRRKRQRSEGSPGVAGDGTQLSLSLGDDRGDHAVAGDVGDRPEHV